LIFSTVVQKGSVILGFLDPLAAVMVSMTLLIVLVYRRVNLGIMLNATALLLALLVYLLF
jgi:hypothetical protein